MKIGVVGYSSGKFNQSEAHRLVTLGLDYLIEIHQNEKEFEIVSGYSNIGIPALAYDYAFEKELNTTGIACSKVFDYDVYPVDKEIIIGDNWGDESETFIEYIDCLLKVGGGDQSEAEAKAFKTLKPNAVVIEFKLERETN